MEHEDPYARALSDYHRGDLRQPLCILTADGRRKSAALERLFTRAGETPLERAALAKCRGSVLDVGAGAGRHSLALHAAGHPVVSVDSCRRAVDIMRERGVPCPRHADVRSYAQGSFDTILLLWHGLGIAETLEGLPGLMLHLEWLLARGGQILAESIEPTGSADQRYQFEYMGYTGDEFPWLNVGFDTTVAVAASVGLAVERIAANAKGEYLCRIVRAELPGVREPGDPSDERSHAQLRPSRR